MIMVGLSSASFHTPIQWKPTSQWPCVAMALDSKCLELGQYLLVVSLNMRLMKLQTAG